MPHGARRAEWGARLNREQSAFPEQIKDFPAQSVPFNCLRRRFSCDDYSDPIVREVVTACLQRGIITAIKSFCSQGKTINGKAVFFGQHCSWLDGELFPALQPPSFENISPAGRLCSLQKPVGPCSFSLFRLISPFWHCLTMQSFPQLINRLSEISLFALNALIN